MANVLENPVPPLERLRRLCLRGSQARGRDGWPFGAGPGRAAVRRRAEAGGAVSAGPEPGLPR